MPITTLPDKPIQAHFSDTETAEARIDASTHTLQAIEYEVESS